MTHEIANGQCESTGANQYLSTSNQSPSISKHRVTGYLLDSNIKSGDLYLDQVRT